MSVNKINNDGSLSPMAGVPNNWLNGIQDNIEKNGCVNIAPFLSLAGMKERNTAGTWNGNTYTLKGITFEVDFDNNTVTVNGTSTNDMATMCVVYHKFTKGKYWGSSTPPSTAGGRTDFNYKTGSATYDVNNVELGSGCGFEITSDEAAIEVNINVRYKGDTMNNAVFKPMITYRTAINSDYAHYLPYAMANRELTNLYKVKTVSVTFPANSIDYWFTVDEIANANGVIVAATMCYCSPHPTIQNYLASVMINTDQYGRLGVRLSSAPSSSFTIDIRVIWTNVTRLT